MARTGREVNRESTAGARYLRISSTKLNQVAALIRGQHIDEARRILAFTPKAASYELSKVLEAAIANAENNHNIAAHELFVKTVQADEGPTLERFRPRALGRAYRIRKRTSHLHITLERRAPEASERPVSRPAVGDQAARRWRRGQTKDTAPSGGSKTAGRRRAIRDRGAKATGRGQGTGSGGPGQAGRAQTKGGDRRGS